MGQLYWGRKHVEHEPSHGRGGVDLLGKGNERDLVLVKHFHHAGKVQQRAAEAVHLNHDAVDVAGGGIGKQALQRCGPSGLLA